MILPPGKFRVGDYEVEPRMLEVRCDGEVVKLEPKVMGVLVDLATAAGETRTKEEIMDSVWPDVTVGEAVLSRSISLLRSTLKDDPKSPRYIETIPRIGYRFVGEVEPLANGAKPAGASLSGEGSKSRAGLPRALVAVLVGLAAVVLFVGRERFSAGTDPGPSAETAPTTTQLPTLLTSSPGAETSPSVSRDGRLVVYAGSSGADAMAVYLLEVGSGEIERLSDKPAAEMWPVFSPSADRVAWMRHWGDECEVIVLDLTSREERLLAPCGNASIVGGLAWSQDGQSLALADGPGAANLQIVFLDLEDGSRTIVTDPPGGHSDAYPAFSPDGRQLAYVRNNAVRVRDLVTGVDREAFSGGPIQGPLAWSEDSSELYFGRGAGVDTDLWAGSLDGELRLIPGGRGGRWPASYPGGLVFGVVSADANVVEMELATGSQRALSPSTRLEVFPTRSPDGSLTFVSGRSGATEVWWDREGQLAQLTNLSADDIYRPRWSPDGQRLVFAAAKDGQVRLYILGRDTGALREILSDGEVTWSGAWGPSGDSVYYTSDQGGEWQLYRYDLDEGKSTDQGVTGAWVCDVGDDGRVYFVRNDGDGIYVWDPAHPDTDAVELIPDFNRLFDFWNWSVRGDDLFAIRRGDNFSPILTRYSVNGGAGEDLAVLAGITWASGLQLTDDGRVLLARIVRRESDLYRLTFDSTAERP